MKGFLSLEANCLMFKMDIRTSRYCYSFALLFTRYLTAIGIIPESLKSIGQFEHAEINEKDLTVS